MPKYIGELLAMPTWRKTLIKTFTKAILKRCYATSQPGAQVTVMCAAHISEYVSRMCGVMSAHEDDEIYDVLCRFANSLVPHVGPTHRTHERVRSIARVIYASGFVITPDTSVLDVGCGDGDIVRTMGEHFGLRYVFGTDLHGPACGIQNTVISNSGVAGPTFMYHQARETYYPFEPHSMDIILLFVTIHHLRNAQFIDSIVRILRPGGLLIIREHDCRSAETAMYLDVVHAVDARVTRQQTQQEFAAEHWANYMSREEVLALFPTMQISYVEEYPAPNPQRLYHVGLRVGVAEQVAPNSE